MVQIQLMDLKVRRFNYRYSCFKRCSELDGDGDLGGDGEDDTSGAFMYYADSEKQVE